MEDDPDTGLVSINPVNIQLEFIRIAADIARWNEKLADAMRAFQLAEYKLETIEAFVYQHVRMEADADGVKLSEAMVQAQVRTNSRYKTEKEQVLHTENAVLRVKGMVQAIITKRDMLISLGAHIREEMKGDPSIRHKQSTDTFNWNE